MTSSLRLHTITAALLIAGTAVTAGAQSTVLASAGTRTDTAATSSAAPTAAATKRDSATDAPKPSAASLLYRPIELQHVRPADQRGLNVFEAPKDDQVPFTGMKLVWGGAFTQQFQGLRHQNTSAPKLVAGVDQNQLINVGNGFNNAVANLDLGVQLAPGIRIAMTTYASARHHQETWVKDGYFLMDASPIDNPILNDIMKVVTLRVGHFEINYGDQHFRRTDNGNSLHNPFVGNMLMDAFTTEIGAEAYARKNGFLAMAGITAGEVHGQVTAPEKRAPTFLGKLGYDGQVLDNLRFRLTGSVYSTAHTANNTLYSGDRAGSRYYDVLENVASNETSNAWSGNVRPGMSDNIRAMVLNPFIKFGGLELFGNIESAKGKSASETVDRTWKQNAGDVVYRFAPHEKLFVGARYNTTNGTLVGIPNNVSVNRTQLAGGWFVTPALLAKLEWVTQEYKDFPVNDIRNGGKFNGFMIEGAVAF